jgi:nucleoside diphosphate kinase
LCLEDRIIMKVVYYHRYAKSGVEISNVKEFEYDTEKIKQLYQDAKSKSELETRVHLGIEELLNQIK